MLAASAEEGSGAEGSLRAICIDAAALNAPMLLVDTAGCGCWESNEEQVARSKQGAAAGAAEHRRVMEANTKINVMEANTKINVMEANTKINRQN